MFPLARPMAGSPMAGAPVPPAGRPPSGPQGAARRAALRRGWLDLETFATASGLHPELVVRLVGLGLIDPAPAVPVSPGARELNGGRPSPPAAARLRFAAAQVATAARIQRLRAGLGLNYAAIGLVLDLLDRVDELEATLARNDPSRGGGAPWTPTG